ncbi:pseudouridine synthase TruD/Pus7 [Penicillium brasilianum]|uniref:Pseudouridine synthase TruD/Pus7 n=1 Tax=Penicillium brasilianum TaxID=104259 RepID=A0A1S9RLS3_PENBI|nr:pseudouridine synthase TruD/Pus7 [Penicillium brasilianum]
MERPELVESPRKRQKIEDVPTADDTVDVLPGNGSAAATDAQTMKEHDVGITEIVTADSEGFSGILKKRYTDFMVNEITPSGQVVHLQNIRAPFSSTNEEATPKATEQPAQKEEVTETPEAVTPAEFKVSEEDNALLAEYFGAENATAIINLHQTAMNSPRARPSELGKVTVVVSDRDLRTKIHQAIRRIFNSQLESSTDSEGNLAITAASNRFKRKAQGHRGGNPGRTGGRMNWDELGGPYLHFTIYKENKDTMEVISYIARTMKMNPKTFQFAGTKDRRGVTAQRACVLRVQAERLANMNKSLRNAYLGDFEYRKHGLELGDLGGNEFVITLRDCEFPGVDMKDPQAAVSKASEIVGTSLKNLHDRGYFNYYGLQRFGTFTTRTDTIGVKMLQDDFKGAAEAILHYPPHVLAAAQEGESSTALISTDDKARAEAIYIFQSTHNVNDALAKLPRKFSAEANIIRHLGRVKNDYLGAIMSIPRNLRLIYVHAYQSLVWNFAASERWRLYGDKVVEGDLVIVSEHRDKEETDAAAANSGVDEDGEVVILPEGENSSYAAEDAFTRARALTAEEAASGKYSIFDVVLPQPGFDVLYPANQMTEFYKKFMGSEQGGGLDPFNMRRKNKDTSLSGSYRKIFSRMGPNFSHEVKLYSEDNEQFVQTDLEKLKGADQRDSAATSQTGDKLAIVLKFQLGSSQYATMALRELSKGLVREYKPDLGGGR